jgi:hypothetical protein
VLSFTITLPFVNDNKKAKAKNDLAKAIKDSKYGAVHYSQGNHETQGSIRFGLISKRA